MRKSLVYRINLIARGQSLKDSGEFSNGGRNENISPHISPFLDLLREAHAVHNQALPVRQGLVMVSLFIAAVLHLP
ncbi:hypothetical protein D3C72_2308080 [compost metagenome]